MKHNLKTFPEKRQAQGLEYFASDVDEWLEGIKKELEDLIQHGNIQYPCNNCSSTLTLLKEILGLENRVQTYPYEALKTEEEGC